MPTTTLALSTLFTHTHKHTHTHTHSFYHTCSEPLSTLFAASITHRDQTFASLEHYFQWHRFTGTKLTKP